MSFCISSFAFLGKPNQLSQTEMKKLSFLKVESGGLLQFEQYLKKSLNHSGGEGYSLNFECLKNKLRKTDCKLVKYQTFRDSKDKNLPK